MELNGEQGGVFSLAAADKTQRRSNVHHKNPFYCPNYFFHPGLGRLGWPFLPLINLIFI